MRRRAVVVDTSVVAYYLLGTPSFVASARSFWRLLKQEPIAPALWEAEIANVLWMSHRAGVLSGPEVQGGLLRAAALGVRSVDMRGLWQGALARACLSGVAVYDALFVELAVREKTRLVTCDRRLLDVFPEWTCRPAEWVH